MSFLPEELIVELQSKLPVKSIFRFRCVSKQWLHLLSSSEVKNLHNKRHNRTPFILAWNEARYDRWLCRQDIRPDVPKHLRKAGYRYYRMYAINMLTNKLHHEFTLDIPRQYCHKIVSCHGLVFFMSKISGGPLGVIHVCNPSTGELIKLPKPSAYYHLVSRTGLGYLPSLNQYKVVRLLYNKYMSEGFEGFEITTLMDEGKADSYSCRLVNRNFGYLGLQQYHLCVNGVIYWLTKDEKRMLAFDLETEKQEILSVPSPDVGHWELIELKGSLYLAEIMAFKSSNNDMELNILKIWMLDDKMWCLKWNSRNDIVCKWFAHLDSSFIADDGKRVLVTVSHRGAGFITNRKGLMLESWDADFPQTSSLRNEDDATYKLSGIPNLGFGRLELPPCVVFDTLFSLNQS